MGLGHVELAMVQAEAAKSRYGPWVFNCQAPDEGNMHTLLHWATPEQAEKYLKPLCKGVVWSCFAMTEPEVAGSDRPLSKPMHTKTGMNGSLTVTSGLSLMRIAQISQYLFAVQKKTQISLRQRTLRSSLTSPQKDGMRSVRSRLCMAEQVTAKSSSKTSESIKTRCLVAGGKATCLDSIV